MADINKIISLIDEYLESTRQNIVEANEISIYLDKNGALRHASNGLPFRKLLRAGKIPNAEQPGGKGTSWYIRHSGSSSKPIVSLSTKKAQTVAPEVFSLANQTVGLTPVSDSESEILILGTLPGKVSLQTRQYYANRGNQFWSIIASLFNDVLPASYEDRLFLLKNHRIALWDVLNSAKRDSSLDSDIENPIANDILNFVLDHPKLRIIGLNGGKASDYFKTYVNSHRLPTRIQVITLPSTSASNTHLNMKDKINLWKSILKS